MSIPSVKHDDRAAMSIARRRVGDACAPSARSRHTTTSGRKARRAPARSRSLPASVGERLQRLQVHVEAENRRFVSFTPVGGTEPQRAEHVARRLARFLDPTPPACCRSRRTAAPPAPAHCRPRETRRCRALAPPSRTTKSSLLQIADEPAVLVAHDRRDRNEVDRRLERRLWRSGGGVLGRCQQRRTQHSTPACRAAITAGGSSSRRLFQGPCQCG